MTWRMFRWVWKVKSPINIGTAPAGILNRTRLYIPARTIWGALTAELSRTTAGNSFPDYISVGENLLQNVRFSYLFPAEKIADEYAMWYPEYSYGLIWKREDTPNNGVPNRTFKSKILYSFPSTSIDPKSDSAEEETLRELECIQPYWRFGNPYPPPEVFMVGYVFFANESVQNQVFSIKELLVGSDTRYGFGHIELVKHSEVSHFLNYEVELNHTNPSIKSNIALGHVAPDPRINFAGDFEILEGRYLQRIYTHGLTWKPGTKVDNGQDVHFEILDYGLWRPIKS